VEAFVRFRMRLHSLYHVILIMFILVYIIIAVLNVQLFVIACTAGVNHASACGNPC